MTADNNDAPKEKWWATGSRGGAALALGFLATIAMIGSLTYFAQKEEPPQYKAFILDWPGSSSQWNYPVRDVALYNALNVNAPKAFDYGGESTAKRLATMMCSDLSRGLSKEQAIKNAMGSASKFPRQDALGVYKSIDDIGYC
ncbi:hypothetical protein [Rhodococcus sp. ARC_M6]|uniref:hypothetical protein n=1 Tax=Rhodococcus sp. ARC_M6 TaxID=2928852 RepID=UPI001FB2B7F6|nr:hypothetical protein [Rhodococcus sp. ARC_M6]MCJ0907093.1 hypothetical protein [Rhodococcus sp. ARC_M6]